MQAAVDLATPHCAPAQLVEVAALRHQHIPTAQQTAGCHSAEGTSTVLHVIEVQPSRLHVGNPEVGQLDAALSDVTTTV